MRIGLISDTHGLLRPEALAALRRVDRIVHAGDIGDPEILGSLRRLAPVAAVRGNNDREEWARRIPMTRSLRLGRHRVFVIHEVRRIGFDPAARGFRVVLSGHSHVPRIEECDGVLFVNPGSAGPRRFRLPVTVGVLLVGPDRIDARIVELPV